MNATACVRTGDVPASPAACLRAKVAGQGFPYLERPEGVIDGSSAASSGLLQAPRNLLEHLLL